MSQENPWKTNSSKIVYKNPWIQVREDQVIQPDGKPGIYGVVECHAATAVVAKTTDNNIYMVGQYRYTTKHYSWEIIEGGSKNYETPLEAAKRELIEEAGLIANKWTQLGEEVHLSNCYSAERAFIFLAEDLIETEKDPDPTEVLSILKIPFKEALDMVRSGKINDALTIIGIERAHIFLENHKI